MLLYMTLIFLVRLDTIDRIEIVLSGTNFSTKYPCGKLNSIRYYFRSIRNRFNGIAVAGNSLGKDISKLE